MEATDIVGYRFHPSDEDLCNHHLKGRLLGIKEKKCVIPDLNIYDYEPWDLPSIYNEKSDKKSYGKEYFFFCPRSNNRGRRTSRQTGGGFWKDTSPKKTKKFGKTVGIKGIYSFYEGKQGKQKKAHKTEWVMHEYHLNALNEGEVVDLGAFTLCCIKRKPKKKEKSSAAYVANLSSPSIATASPPVEVEETNQELQIGNAVINTDGNESIDSDSGMILDFNVDKLLENIEDAETTSPSMFQQLICPGEEILANDDANATTTTTTPSGANDIDNYMAGLFDFAEQCGDLSELLGFDCITGYEALVV